MKKWQFKASVAATVLGVLSPLAMVVPASAATQTYVSLDATNLGKMSATTSWVSGVTPTTGDTVVFPASANYQTINNDIMSLYLAKVVFSGEVSTTSSKSFQITGNSLALSEGIDAIMTGNGGDHSVATNVTLGANATFKTSGSNTLSVGGDSTTLDLGTHDLTLDASGGTISLLGKIAGSGKIVTSGSGKVKVLATPGTGYTGSFEVTTGEFSVQDAFGAANVVINGGTLKGTGSVGDVTLNSGSIAPGNSPGCLNTGDLSLTGGTYDVELGGKSVSACEYDNMAVTGSVNLGSATTLNLSLVISFVPTVKDTFSIILNDSTDAVQGTFKGLSEGGKFTVGAYTYQISYKGGDGNDVVLTATGTPSAPDTGSNSLLANPLVTIVAAITVAGAVAGHRYHELKKARK
jgi:hypothetical protein